MKKLTLRTFLLLLALSLFVLLSAYGCIWIFLPYATEKKARHTLEQKSSEFADALRTTAQQDSEPLFTAFLRETGADILLLDEQEQCISPFTFMPNGASFDITSSGQAFADTRCPFRFAGSTQDYILIIRYNPARFDEITHAMRRSVPYVLLIILLLSCASALLFSHYTTLPIIRIGKIADRIANLDFSWYCPDIRDDEIGALSQSINELSDKLHAALEEIYRRNALLEDEISLEKERERRRLLFFSGVSHELKTPIAIVIGQLEGMQAQIGIYKNREKYLARSKEILQSLNSLIREVLSVSHLDLETQKAPEPVCLSQILKAAADDYNDYAGLSAITVTLNLTPDIQVYGDAALLKKALGNVVGNAILHSPERGTVTVSLSLSGGKAALRVSNAPAHIDEKHLPHLFEAFYRIDRSAGHGSGLGLYITRMILETYHVPHSIENTTDGVCFTAVFDGALASGIR